MQSTENQLCSQSTVSFPVGLPRLHTLCQQGLVELYAQTWWHSAIVFPEHHHCGRFHLVYVCHWGHAVQLRIRLEVRDSARHKVFHTDLHVTPGTQGQF